MALRGQAAHFEQRGVELIEHARGPALQQPAGVAELDFARAAVQQLHAQLLLQIGDAAAHRGLGQPHGFAGAAEVLLLGHGQEHAQLPQGDIHE